MRIGITVDIRHSMFSSGYTNACFSIAETLRENHKVIFLHQQEDRTWWDDVSLLQSEAPKVVSISDFLKDSLPLDLLIEVSYFVSPITRKSLAKHCVWYCRKSGLINDLESSV